MSGVRVDRPVKVTDLQRTNIGKPFDYILFFSFKVINVYDE